MPCKPYKVAFCTLYGRIVPHYLGESSPDGNRSRGNMLNFGHFMSLRAPHLILRMYAKETKILAKSR